jgi:hypothetical protein
MLEKQDIHKYELKLEQAICRMFRPPTVGGPTGKAICL